jgi:hypothetical protein
MKIAKRFAVLATSLVIAACGGGSDDSTSLSFISWAGNSEGEIVRDANFEAFRVTRSPSCVYSDQYARFVTNWCRVGNDPNTARLLFVDRYIQVIVARRTNGQCVATFLDERTSRIIDIFRTGDVMIYTLSDVVAVRC